MRPRRPTPILLALLALAAREAAAQDGGAPVDRFDHFVRVEGDHFVQGGRPFTFVGANLHVVHGELTRARFRETLAAAAADGLRVGRVWAFGEGPADASDWYRRAELFRAGPDGFIEAAYVHLDEIVAEAGARGLRLIVTLSNNWGDYGGIPMYLRWAGLPPGDGPNDPAREAFFRDERVRAFFRAGLERLLSRVNTITGRRYTDDPTILSWELMNESSAPTPAGAEARLAWIAEMAGFIKARDPNHLVAAGLAGYGSRDERDAWIRAHKLPAIDYCDSHLYPEYADAVDPTGRRDMGRAAQRLLDFIDDRAQLARFVVGKPLVIGEFGFRTDVRARRALLGGPRDGWFRRVLDRLFLDGGAGALVWIYQPWTGQPRDFGVYTDQPDTDDVRAVLRTAAARAGSPPEARNDRLGPSVGERFLYEPQVTLEGDPRPHARWRRAGRDRVLAIAPEKFTEARFERVGIARTGVPVPHAWGSGWGHFRYRFAPPLAAKPATRLRIEAQLSSEWPGRSAPKDGGSRVEVRIDGARVGQFDAPPDDGRGARAEILVEDRALLARLARPGAHSLAFDVQSAPGNHGLCIYDAPSGAIRLTWERAPARTPRAPARTALDAN